LACRPIIDVVEKTISDDPTVDRALGCLLGLAVGDALGTTLEFTERDMNPPLTDMIGGGPCGLKPGEWTDDTSLALCLADSLIACGGLDQRDLMERFVRLWRECMSCWTTYYPSWPSVCAIAASRRTSPGSRR
jgi:ADP-ribosylglycohydrolase